GLYSLALHDALPICSLCSLAIVRRRAGSCRRCARSLRDEIAPSFASLSFPGNRPAKRGKKKTPQAASLGPPPGASHLLLQSRFRSEEHTSELQSLTN